jgi:hypothetical protein
MAFIYHTFTNQGAAAGSTEVANYMTENFPGLFDSYVASSTNVWCKMGNTTVLTLYNSTNSGAGYNTTAETMSHSFNVSNQAVYRGVIADTDTETVVFLSGGGEYPIITLCKNEDGDTCGVSFNTTGNTSLLMGQAGTINTVQPADVFVYNFTRGTYQKIPCGFARTEQNAVCGFPLVDKDGRKIQNVWVCGSSALRNLANPIEINIDDSIYCSIKYGWLLIK